MRLQNMPSPLYSLLAAVVLARPVFSIFVPSFPRNLEDLQNLWKRCDNPCGYDGWLCCQSNQVCYTDANDQAQCGVAAPLASAATQAQGTWQYYTTTYVQTDLKTVTATFSSYVPQATPSCLYSMGQTLCGSTCCLSGQWCQSDNVCVGVGGGSSGYYSNQYTVTTVVTNTASVPLRPTSQTLVTITSTGSATTTGPFQTPVGTGGSVIGAQPENSGGGGLSGGAIAGIVIGVIAAIIILLIICACCCFKGLLDGLLAIFGLGPRKKRVVETEEVYESRRHSNRPGRTWFGTRPSRPGRTEVVEEKKSSGWGTGASVAAFLGGLALILGIKRRRDKKDEDKNSVVYGSSYYSYTESSESSSDRRTRRSSRSRSRVSRR